MLKRHKDLLRYVVTELRHTLAGYTGADGTEQRGDLDREMERLGIMPDGHIMPRDVLPNPTAAESWARRAAEAELAAVPQGQRARVREQIVERVAYSWINRLLALRALEARGLIDETLRSNPDYDGLSEALFVLRQVSPDRARGTDGGWWAVIDDACKAQAEALPGLFALDDPSVALWPTTAALLRCVGLIGGGALPGFTLAESDATFADPDAIGWAYQFYQEEAKAQVYLKLKNGGKVETRDEIAAATQLFTEPYMVKWLLQNSLGRSYHELYPDSALPATWEYYIRPDALDKPAVTDLASLTLLDPCVGSGHFLREAFDMLVAMYREQQPDLSAVEIADRVLTQHLHGIDIDPRTTQLAALTLYLRAWELVRDERRAQRKPGAGRYQPPTLNLATTTTGLDADALDRHLRRFPQDRLLKPLLAGVFAALEQADMLGSLLRPREHLQAAIAELRKPHNLRLGTPEEQDLQAAIETVARIDPIHLEDMLLDRVAAGFAAQARDTGDVAAALFGHAAERGVRLLQLLDHHYAVVVTNPPYMGSKNMDAALLKYVERHYTLGKGNLSTVFILRCIELGAVCGRMAMVPPQTWMFQSTFADLRAVTAKQVRVAGEPRPFQGVLRETSLEGVVQLGRHAFSEVDPPANPVLISLRRNSPSVGHHIWSCRLSSPQPSERQAQMLRQAVSGQVKGLVFRPAQIDYLSIPDSPLMYWLRPRILGLMRHPIVLEDVARFVEPSTVGESGRFLRAFWECEIKGRWMPISKGGGFAKWSGLQLWMLQWDYCGARVKRFPGSYVRNEEVMFHQGVTYSEAARGKLGARILDEGETFGKSGPGIIANASTATTIISLMNSRLYSYLARVLSRGFLVSLGTVGKLPYLDENRIADELSTTASACVALKRILLSTNHLERTFAPGPRLRSHASAGATALAQADAAVQAVLHTLEGLNERLVCNAYGLDEGDVAAIMAETGTPVGWYPLLPGYAALPPLPDGMALPDELCELLAAHLVAVSPDTVTSWQRIGTADSDDPGDCGRPSTGMRPQSQASALKARLRALYEAGPGANAIDEAEKSGADDDTTEASEAMVGAYLPIPTETFLEELSQKLQIHPISVYGLLQEVHAEGARCKPEEKRLLEDRLSVIVLRLLGHRWLKQIEAGEPVPAWADRDGIIPLLAGSGEAPLAERVRERLRAEEGDLGAQQAEALLAELTGRSLEEWLRHIFFPRHVRQFKYRPIVWHLASTPGAGVVGRNKGGRGRASARQAPAFECMVYYHASGLGLLARLRTQYVEPLLRTERGRVDAARKAGDDTAAAQATARVQELEAFVERLRGVEERGFDTPDLEEMLKGETLDRWTGDGILAPVSRDALLAQERAWAVDINDGVRVNIAPLQLAGVLASDVLKTADAKKAIADRARWRADERRWVREGQLPRCGWMSADVPESPCWTELAPQRAIEQRKLEQKRQETLAQLEGTASSGP